MIIEIISATRLTEKEFWETSALGLSLQRLKNDKTILPRITFTNKKGLPQIYNEGIEKADIENMLVFIHDDVWIDDYFFSQRIQDGLHQFDIIGVAGNVRHLPQQPAWAFVDQKFTWDEKINLSGAVAHGKYPFGALSYFGDTPKACALLDGVFLATHKKTLVDARIKFDEQFDFHLYDMDFCREAIKAKLTLGTWPIALTHQSGGHFGTPHWQSSYKKYLSKWKD